jgi:hypothetical protein
MAAITGMPTLAHIIPMTTPDKPWLSCITTVLLAPVPTLSLDKVGDKVEDKVGDKVGGSVIMTGVGSTVTSAAGVVDGDTVVDVGVATGVFVAGADTGALMLSRLVISIEHSATIPHPGIGGVPTSHMQTRVTEPGRGGPHVPVNICPSTVLVERHVPSHHSGSGLLAVGGTWCHPAEALHTHENVACELDATRGVPLPPQTGDTGHRLAPTLMRSVMYVGGAQMQNHSGVPSSMLSPPVVRHSPPGPHPGSSCVNGHVGVPQYLPVHPRSHTHLWESMLLRDRADSRVVGWGDPPRKDEEAQHGGVIRESPVKGGMNSRCQLFMWLCTHVPCLLHACPWHGWNGRSMPRTLAGMLVVRTSSHRPVSQFHTHCGSSLLEKGSACASTVL